MGAFPILLCVYITSFPFLDLYLKHGAGHQALIEIHSCFPFKRPSNSRLKTFTALFFICRHTLCYRWILSPWQFEAIFKGEKAYQPTLTWAAWKADSFGFNIICVSSLQGHGVLSIEEGKIYALFKSVTWVIPLSQGRKKHYNNGTMPHFVKTFFKMF